MNFPKINNWKLYYYTVLLFALLICIPFETLAQNNKSKLEKQQVHFAWMPYLDEIYYQFIFDVPKTNAAHICKKLSADKNLPRNFSISRSQNSISSIQFYPIYSLRRSLKNLPNEKMIGGIYVNPNILHGPAATVPMQYFTPKQEQELNLLQHPELALTLYNRPVKRGVKCIPGKPEIVWQVMEGQLSNDASASPPVNETSEFLPEYRLDKFNENFGGQRNDNISNEKSKTKKPLQRPILLIPGHDMELMDKCSSALMELTKAKKQLQRAQDDYEKELRIWRNLYRTKNNRVIDLKKLLEQLFQGQNELEKMDNTGTSKARINAAKEQGKIDITSAIGKLNLQRKKANKAKLDLVRFKSPTSKKRMAINKLEKQLQSKIKILDKCLKLKEKTTASGVNIKPEQQPDRADNSRIPDIPEDLPVDEPVKKKNNNSDNHQSDKSVANMNLLFPRVPYIADMNVEGAISKIYQDGNKTRYETSASLASIILLDQSIIWQMFFDLGVYVTMPLPQKLPPTIIKQEMLGKEVVNGYKVTKYHIIQSGVDGYYADGLYWITSEGITVKSQASEIVNGKARTSRFELSNIVIGPIDPSKFKVPKRLKLSKFPLQMGK